MPEKPATAREDLLRVEAILRFLMKPDAMNDENADVIVHSLAKSAKEKLSDAISKLPQ